MEFESATRNANVFSVRHSERYCKTARSTATRATAALFDCRLVNMVAIQKRTPCHMKDRASLSKAHLLWNLNNGHRECLREDGWLVEDVTNEQSKRNFGEKRDRQRREPHVATVGKMAKANLRGPS